MTDREMLELAALAAGIKGRYFWNIDDAGIEMASGIVWNPLTDDGAALRLAVMLGLLVGIRGDEVWAQKYMGNHAGWLTIKEPSSLCRFSTTRRAIVRAAAAIGAAQRAQAQKEQSNAGSVD